MFSMTYISNSQVQTAIQKLGHFIFIGYIVNTGIYCKHYIDVRETTFEQATDRINI